MNSSQMSALELNSINGIGASHHNVLSMDTNVTTIESDSLHLIDIQSYLQQHDDYDEDLEIDEKTQAQIRTKRDELNKEYSTFISTKTELLKLRVESITDSGEINNEIIKMRHNILDKKRKMEEQYENFISDYIKIAQLTLTSRKKVNLAQTFMFEQDAQYQTLMSSALSDDDKYELRAKLQETRHGMVEQYLAFYARIMSTYSQHIQNN